MKRVGLVVAYDGTNYSGWQIQPNGITIQGVLNDALSDLLGEKIEIMGASRTDAGVHALGNVAVLIRILVFREKRFPMHSIRDCRKISAFSYQKKWSRIFIRDTATVKNIRIPDTEP